MNYRNMLDINDVSMSLVGGNPMFSGSGSPTLNVDVDFPFNIEEMPDKHFTVCDTFVNDLYESFDEYRFGLNYQYWVDESNMKIEFYFEGMDEDGNYMDKIDMPDQELIIEKMIHLLRL